MDFDKISSDQINIQVNRHIEENKTMITVSIYDHGLMIEAYNSCELEIKAERTMAFWIMRKLDINAEAIKSVMNEDYFND